LRTVGLLQMDQEAIQVHLTALASSLMPPTKSILISIEK
jgi:hypothetical protein